MSLQVVDVNKLAWTRKAACRGPEAPSMFEDQWRSDRPGRLDRARAIKTCILCPVQRQCGTRALEILDGGTPLYGVWCGVEFTDVSPARQEKHVRRLRALMERL